jgi:hypothetical protein
VSDARQLELRLHRIFAHRYVRRPEWFALTPADVKRAVDLMMAAAIGVSLDELAGPVELPKVKEPPPKKRGRPRKHNKED